MKCVSYFLSALPVFVPVYGQNIERKCYRSVILNSAPLINGTMDDPALSEGERIDDFTQFEPFNRKATSLHHVWPGQLSYNFKLK
jgi:hypothetical protein